MQSYPARGMGIEISVLGGFFTVPEGHTPRGVWGLKSVRGRIGTCHFRHTPRGVWGLKYRLYYQRKRYRMSYPARGMGIEIVGTQNSCRQQYCHTPRGVWGLKFLE